MPAMPALDFDRVTLSLYDQKHIEQFLLEPSDGSNQYWESLDNPVAGELGITTRQELEDFLENALPKFKLVTHCRLGPNVARLRWTSWLVL